MKNSFLQKKVVFLANKLNSLKEELKISKEIIHLASTEIERLYKEDRDIVAPQAEEQETTIKQPSQDQFEKHTEFNSEAPDTAVKKLFRKIALKIHPDKIDPNLSEFEKKSKCDMFIEAQKALSENDLISLSSIAINLNIKIPDISKIEIKKTEKEISDIKKQLNGIESKLAWKWFVSNNEDEKKEILNKIFLLLDQQRKK